MKEANKQLRHQFKEININEIEDMQDDMSDMLEQANEIQETLGRNYSLPDDIDEADLEAGVSFARASDWFAFVLMFFFCFLN